MKHAIFIGIFIILLCEKIFAQNSFLIYNSRHGYNSQEAMTVFSDSRGFLWIGGVDGLNRFDGSEFVHYSKDDGLIDSEIQGISEDSRHNLWIATINGISYFDGNKFINYSYSFIDTSYKTPYFINVFESSKGFVYACSATGLYKLDINKKIFQQLPNIKTYVSDIIEDKDGILWVAASLALYKIKNNVFEKIDLQPIINYNTATCLAFDKRKQLWIGTTKGILKYDGKKFLYYFKDIKANNNIKDVIVLNDGTLLFNSETPELKYYKNDKFEVVNLSKEIGNVDIQHIVEDNEGNIWMAANNLIKISKNPLHKYFLSDTINSNVNAISILNNDLYFGTDDGLKIVKDEEIKTIYPQQSLNNKIITALCKTDTSMLVGTSNGAIYNYYKNHFFLFDTNTLAHDKVYNILKINNREYWVSKNITVEHYWDNHSKQYLLSDIVAAPTQNCIMDSEKSIWFANLENLSIYKNGVIEKIGREDGFRYKSPVTIIEDKNKIIWVGTYGDGLVKYNRKNSINFTTKNGLVCDYIQASFYDSKSNIIWLTTRNGISKILLDAKSDILSIKNYLNQDDNLNLICNQNSIFKLNNGNMIFGCGNQLIEYDNSKANDYYNELPIYFEGLRLNYEKIEWSKEGFRTSNWSNMPIALELPYNKNHLTFDFRSINFNDPKNIKFQWKLLNTENNWAPESKNNSVTYSNLSPGSYIFCCRVKGSSGIWSKPISFSFIITPPFYQTKWFTPLLIFFLISAAFVSSRIKIKKIQRQEALKTENYRQLAEVELKAMRAQMNPHFLFNTLNSIQEIVLSKEDAIARIYLADFALMMRMILENSSQKKITLERELDFIKLYLKLEKLRFEDKFSITIDIEKSIDEQMIKLPPMLIQPYIENAILHGLMHKVTDGILNITFGIVSREEKQFLTCIIKDNGVGRKKSQEFSKWKEKKHQSMSTEITSERISLLNNINKGYKVNIIDLENDLKQPLGTKVEIYIPIK